MDIQQLRNFIVTAEYEHLSHAAEEMNISQSALSYSINQLESELGISLFDRIGRNIKLNNAGLLFKQYATEIVQLSEEAKISLNEKYGLESRSVVMQSIPLSLYDHLFDQLYAAESNIEIIPIGADTPAVLADNLINQKTDLCFIPFPLPDTGLDHIELCENTILALVSETHPLAKEELITADQLKAQEFISGATAIASYFLDSLSKACKFTPNVRFRCATHEEAFYLVRKTSCMYLIGDNVFSHMKEIYDCSHLRTIALDSSINSYRRLLYWRKKGNPSQVTKLRNTLIHYFTESDL